MLKNRKLAVVAMAGVLAVCLGLAACGGNASSSSSASGAAASSSSAASSSAASKGVLYWTGALSDGSTMSYMDDPESGQAALAVAKDDYSSGTMWLGSAVAEGDAVTITDAESKKTVSFTILESNPGKSMRIDAEGYGEVELKPVTEADFKAMAGEISETVDSGQRLLNILENGGKGLSEELAKEVDKLVGELAKLDEKTALFWDGSLADGSPVSYADDPESGRASLSIIKADYSDGATWAGKRTTAQDGAAATITDAESGKTVAYEIAETVPDTSLKMNIEGYGEVTLKPVTKGDLVKFAEGAGKYLGSGK